MKRIPLTQGQSALVDDGDYRKLMKFKWCAHRHHDRKVATFYAVRNILLPDGRRVQIKMHQQIMHCRWLDHKDGNGLNNQKINLRKATQSQQEANKKLRRDNTSGYKGVVWFRRDKCWKAQIGGQRRRRKNRHIGYFNTAEEAARAYDHAAIESFGEFARLNFPRSNKP